MATIIDGVILSASIKNDIKNKLTELCAKFQDTYRPPCVAIILCNSRIDSKIYVNMKKKACDEVGFNSKIITLNEVTVSYNEIMNIIDFLNKDNKTDAILFQLPLPVHLVQYKHAILESIEPEKNIDGFSLINMAKLVQWNYEADFIPCTARGVFLLLKSVNAKIVGADIVVVGCSNTVGLPIALGLMKMGGTVTICHSQTLNLIEKVKNADILIVAVGKPNLIVGAWIKKDAIVIDVGINEIKDITKKNGYRIVGDVEFETAKLKAKYISPVPGGCGPMTVISVLLNTLDAFEKKFK